MTEVAAGASMLGTYMQVQGARAQGKAEAAALRYNAAIRERNAKKTEIDAQFTQLTRDIADINFVDDFAELQSEVGQRTRKNGFIMSGTGLDVYINNAKQADEELVARQVETFAEIQGIQEQGVNERLAASLNRMDAQSALRASRYRAMSAAISGISRTAYMLR